MLACKDDCRYPDGMYSVAEIRGEINGEGAHVGGGIGPQELLLARFDFIGMQAPEFVGEPALAQSGCDIGELLALERGRAGFSARALFFRAGTRRADQRELL